MSTTERFLVAMAIIYTVWIAGVELDLAKAWEHRRESGISAGLALGMPLPGVLPQHRAADQLRAR